MMKRGAITGFLRGSYPRVKVSDAPSYVGGPSAVKGDYWDGCEEAEVDVLYPRPPGPPTPQKMNDARGASLLRPQYPFRGTTIIII
jgi:hypothetical protein